MKLLVIDKPDDAELCEKIIRLKLSVWPREGGGADMAEEVKALQARNNKHAFNRNILLFDDEELIGCAKVFDRQIKIGGALVNNMALAGVCVRKSRQGHGLGKQIVLKAFEFVDDGGFECSLFQTGVPLFYAKLGAKEIGNAVINSLGDGRNPFWDPHAILYPGSYDAGDCAIDILGDGY